jgi:hypothetical protein
MFNEINAVGPERAAERLLTTAITARQQDARGHVTHLESRGLRNRRRHEYNIYQGRVNPWPPRY